MPDNNIAQRLMEKDFLLNGSNYVPELNNKIDKNLEDHLKKEDPISGKIPQQIKEEYKIENKNIPSHNCISAALNESTAPSLNAKKVYSKPENQEYWFKNRDNDLEKKYSEIAPDIPMINVKHRDMFIQRCKRYYEEIVQNVSSVKDIERWDEYEIIRMFGKGLNPTSLKTTLNNINFFVNNIIPDGDTVRVVEYGPGSGWSTLMLQRQLSKKFQDKKIEVFAVDMSPHSIVATQNSLDYYQIPWQTRVDGGNISNETGTITLVLDDFIGFSRKQNNNYFDGFFSSHGTAYLSESECIELLKVMKDIGKGGAIFVEDTLDPLYTVRLDTMHLILCSIFPSITKKMKEYTYGKSLSSNSKYFPGGEVKKLTKVNNEESMLFYRWNHYLLSKWKFRYISQMLKSMKITTDVIEEYREDVYPAYLIKNLIKKEKLTNWEMMLGLPSCPLYITNCGFRLVK